MEIERRIEKVGRYHLALFLLPVLSVLYYGWLRAPLLNERPDNPQRIAPLHTRGAILDRRDQPLAFSQGLERVYPMGEAVGSLVGYQLRGRNHSGLEAILQIELSPPLPPASLTQAIQQDQEVSSGLHQPLRGPDINLTLDGELQQKLYAAFENRAGAMAVADRKGRILAAVSAPSFDSALVGQEWQKLRDDERSPFIERVGSGFYPVRLPQGDPLLRLQETANSPWFANNPFPGYPGAASALEADGTVLVTPLMLLEFAYFESGVPIPALTLLDSGVSESTKEGQGVRLTPTRQNEESQVWELIGPPFRESEEFIVWIGNVKGERFFSLVIETSDPASTLTAKRLIDLLGKETPSPEDNYSSGQSGFKVEE